jgi:hypothetical protein
MQLSGYTSRTTEILAVIGSRSPGFSATIERADDIPEMHEVRVVYEA